MANFSLAAFLRAASVAMIAGLGIGMSGIAHSTAPRFQVEATLSPAPSVQSGSNGIRLDARLTAQPKSPSGGGYSLVARVTSTIGCSDDTIFVDGFDGLVP